MGMTAGGPIVTRVTGRRCGGKKNSELGPDSEFGAEFDPPALLLHSPIDAGQTQTRGLAIVVGREERLKDPSLDLRGHTTARIADDEADKISCSGLPIRLSLATVEA